MKPLSGSHHPWTVMDKKDDMNDDNGKNEESSTDEDEVIAENDSQFTNIDETKLKHWANLLHNRQTAIQGFSEVKEALRAVVEHLNGTEQNTTSFRVNRSSSNAVVMFCFTEVPNGMRMFLGPKKPINRMQAGQKWSKYKTIVKQYLKDLLELLDSMVDPSASQAILNHGIYPILDYYLGFSSLRFSLVKKLALMWSTGNFHTRVLSFIGVFRIARALEVKHLTSILQAMYLSYVKNCKYTSPRNIPSITFMRQSLVELYTLDLIEAYKQAFIYVRQIAFQVRNAMILKTEDKIHLVYNWQMVHSLHLWLDLLSTTYPSEVLQPLLFPVVQIGLAMCKLQVIPKYYPLQVYICNLLIKFSEKTSIFIPVLPILLEILRNPPFLKLAPVHTVKPHPWLCILKLTASQIKHSSFHEETIKQLNGSILEYLSNECHTIGFPELSYPVFLEVKTFVKECAVPAYKVQMKTLLQKIDENVEFIKLRRKSVTFALSEKQQIHNWEIACRQNKPPLLLYYETWKKGRDAELERLMKGTSDDDDSGSHFTPWSEILKKRKEKQFEDEADKILLAEEEPETTSNSVPLAVTSKKNLEENDDIDFNFYEDSDLDDEYSTNSEADAKEIYEDKKDKVKEVPKEEGNEVADEDDVEEEDFEDEFDIENDDKQLMSDDEEDMEEDLNNDEGDKPAKVKANDRNDVCDELSSDDDPEDQVELMPLDDLVFEDDIY